MYVGELFPSEIISIAYAYVSTIGTLGASVSPYIKEASKNWSMGLMSMIALIAAGHVFLLRETKNTVTIAAIPERLISPKEQETTK